MRNVLGRRRHHSRGRGLWPAPADADHAPDPHTPNTVTTPCPTTEMPEFRLGTIIHFRSGVHYDYVAVSLGDNRWRTTARVERTADSAPINEFSWNPVNKIESWTDLIARSNTFSVATQWAAAPAVLDAELAVVRVAGVVAVRCGGALPGRRPDVPPGDGARAAAHCRVAGDLSRGEPESGAADARARVGGDDARRVRRPVRLGPGRGCRSARYGAGRSVAAAEVLTGCCLPRRWRPRRAATRKVTKSSVE
jgi:hypothetical protein